MNYSLEVFFILSVSVLFKRLRNIHKKIVTLILLMFLLLSLLMLTGCFVDTAVEVSDRTAEKALQIALEQQDKSYVWGGRGPDEFDCSGLITWAYKQAVGRKKIFSISGYTTTDATMSDLYYWNVKQISLEEMEAGDIIFMTSGENEVSHGGLFIEWINEKEFLFVHASSARGKVVTDHWNTEKSGAYHELIGAGRLTADR